MLIPETNNSGGGGNIKNVHLKNIIGSKWYNEIYILIVEIIFMIYVF